ncbi:MAG: hypothetical protein M0Z77_04570 [Thermoplasmatales archaeon]|nr:hypothetical protein [Thermoplasmatales archaeon]
MSENPESSNSGNDRGRLHSGAFYPFSPDRAKSTDSEVMSSLGIPIVPFEHGRLDDIGKRVPRAVLNAREDFFLQKKQSWWNLFPAILRNVVEDGATVGGFEVLKDEGTRTMVVGGPGSGKSTVAASYVVDASHFGTVVAADDSGDLLWKVLSILPVEEWNRIVLLKSGSKEGESSVGTVNLLHPPNLNVNESTIPSFITGLINMQRTVLYDDKLFGTKIQQYFGDAIKVLYRSGNRTNLHDVYRMLLRPDLGLQMLSSLRNTSQKDQLLEDVQFVLRQAVNNRVDLSSAYRYAAQLTQSSDLTRFFCDRDPCFDYRALLHPDARYIVIIYVPSSSMQKQNSYQAISGLVSYIYGLKESLSQLPQDDDEGKNTDYRSSRLFFVLDEFQNYLNDDIDRIITQGRKINVSSLLLTQNARKLVTGGGRNWFPPMKNNFNNILVNGITDTDEMRMFGLDRKANPYDLQRVNGVKGRFYWIDHNPPVVSTLYSIQEMDPNALAEVIKLLDDHYKYLESSHGIRITRDLWDGSEAYSDLEASSSVDDEFALTSMLYAVFILTHGSRGRVVRKDIMGAVDELSRNAPELGEEAGYSLFPRMDPKFAAGKLEDLVRNGYVFKKTVNTGTIYSITGEGERHLMESLGSGASGGGTEHRMTILETAQRFYFHRETSKEGDAIYPYVTTVGCPLRPVPDMILNFRTSPRMVSLFKGLEKCAVEVQISKQSISAFREKFSIINSGVGMLILCPEEDVDYYRNMINKLYPEYDNQEIAGVGNGNPLDYVYVQRIVEGATDITVEPHIEEDVENEDVKRHEAHRKELKLLPPVAKEVPQEDKRPEPSARGVQRTFNERLIEMMNAAGWSGVTSGEGLSRMFCRLDSALSRPDPGERLLPTLPLLRFAEKELSIDEKDARVLLNVYLASYTSEFFSSGSERFLKRNVSQREMEPWRRSIEKYGEGYSMVNPHLIVELPPCEEYYGKEWPRPVLGLYDDEGGTGSGSGRLQNATPATMESGDAKKVTKESSISTLNENDKTINRNVNAADPEACMKLVVPEGERDYGNLFKIVDEEGDGGMKGAFPGLAIGTGKDQITTRNERMKNALVGALYAQFSVLRHLNPNCDLLRTGVPLLAGLSLIRKLLRSMKFNGAEISSYADQALRAIAAEGFDKASLESGLQGGATDENGSDIGEIVPIDPRKLDSATGLLLTADDLEKALSPDVRVFLQSHLVLYILGEGQKTEVSVSDLLASLRR